MNPQRAKEKIFFRLRCQCGLQMLLTQTGKTKTNHYEIIDKWTCPRRQFWNFWQHTKQIVMQTRLPLI
jgi:hypothetical protein